jgi:hypothetical protein
MRSDKQLDLSIRFGSWFSMIDLWWQWLICKVQGPLYRGFRVFARRDSWCWNGAECGGSEVRCEFALGVLECVRSAGGVFVAKVRRLPPLAYDNFPARNLRAETLRKRVTDNDQRNRHVRWRRFDLVQDRLVRKFDFAGEWNEPFVEQVFH